MKWVFALPVFGFLAYQVFTSEMSRNAWHSAGTVTSRQQQGEASSTVSNVSSETGSQPSALPIATLEEGCKNGKCRRMKDHEKRQCWSVGAAKIMSDYGKTYGIGSEFLIKDCPEGPVIGVFEVHSNSPKGVSLFFPAGSPALAYAKD